ncbi:MFS transporter [Fodinisporobacter ferrooxydans]|uniref:MFS transporter n=1 Tax=Fodinisporobacter ferrooxydans TaxID=2901836 RepID=A0ABY4CDZ0_9BACL|nr:MFS transporter [Alicyclobacillaceae bacterium MYW30-H2]
MQEKITRSIAFTTFVAAMGAFLDGYDLSLLGGVFLFIKPLWHLTPGQIGLIGSVGFLGMALGGIIFGRVTDKLGRRESFIIDLIILTIGGVLCAVSPNLSILVIGRFLVGFGIGADIPISTSLIAEISPTDKRGFLTGMMQPFWFIGAASSGVISALFVTYGNDQAWRWIFGTGVIIAIVVILLRMRIPESPRWLAAKQSKETIRVSQVKTLFVKPYLLPLIVVSLFWFLVVARGASFNTYMPILLKMFGFHSKAAALWMNSLLWGIYALTTIGFTFFIDKFKRRTLVIYGWLFDTILTGSLAFVHSSQAALFVILMLCSTIFNQLVTIVLYPWSVEFFPTMLRATAQGISTGARNVGGVATSLVFPIIMSSFGWEGAVLSVVTVMAVGLALGIVLRPVETTKRSLEEISDEHLTLGEVTSENSKTQFHV